MHTHARACAATFVAPSPVHLAVQVVEVINGTDVVCLAKNDALLDGLLTLFHVERSTCVLWLQCVFG